MKISLHRGVIGAEAGIIMIAFVIIAAALAFVVLNSGFDTTQKAKTSILSSLGQASSTLEIVGNVIGVACHDNQCGAIPLLNATGVSIKLASGVDSVNFDPETTAVTLMLNGIEYSDIYKGVITGAGNTASSLEEGFDLAKVETWVASNPVDEDPDQTETVAFIYFTQANGDPNKIMVQGEHAVLALSFEASERPATLDTMKIEIITDNGATLLVERDIPLLDNSIVNLG